MFIQAERGFARSRAVENAEIEKLILIGQVEPPIFDAGRADVCFRRHLAAVSHFRVNVIVSKFRLDAFAH